MSTSGSILGNAVRRKEDPGLLKGECQYYDDLRVEGLTHLVFVRSTIAHATIESIDTTDAAGMPGVLGVFTAEDLALADVAQFELLPPVFNRPPLARDRVRFVGDIVAVVVAETLTQATDAAEMVIVDYEPLDAVADLEAAVAPDAPLLFPDNGSNVCFLTEIGMDEDPLEGAEVVVSERILSQKLAGAPMETNGCVAVPTDGGHYTVWIPSQNPINVRPPLAAMIEVDPETLRVAAPWVGGGFGSKAGLYIEFGLTTALAKRLGRPVKWTESRSENMVAMNQGRGMVMNASLGVNRDGRIVGLKADVLADAGAYPAIGAVLPMLTQTMSQAVYNIPRIQFRARSLATNTTQTAAYRGAGRPEATQMVERILDVAADAIGMDPAEIRRVNFIQPEQFPYTTLTGANYDSGDYEKALDAALAAAGYSELRAEQQARRDRGDRVQLGIGVSSYVEITAPLGLHAEWGKVTIEEDGSATVRVGTSAHGQGHDTAFSMIVSDLLGIPMDKIRLVQSDTDEIPSGQGTMGSRSLQTAGSAVHEASNVVLAKAKELAAHILEADAEDMVVAEAGLAVAGVPAKAVSWAVLAEIANDDEKRPHFMEKGLEHELVFDEGDSTFPFGSHVAVVEVDTETGGVKLVRHIAVDDCGTILNPLLVAGQQHGGIAQGVAQALYEWVRYDDDANPVSASLMDYLVPSATELPSFEVSNTETPSPRNPIGAKGIGESGTIGSTPAVHNAVVDAVSHLGVTHIDMPTSPQRIWEALNAN